jgi:hypothetical protein
MTHEKLIAGAITGFLTAVLVDLDAWRVAGGSFNWQKALYRGIGGAIAGVTAAAGLS